MFILKVAFIDSGIDSSMFPDWNIVQYYIERENILKEKPHDPLGHGTSMFMIFSKTSLEKCEIISLRAGGDLAINT